MSFRPIALDPHTPHRFNNPHDVESFRSQIQRVDTRTAIPGDSVERVMASEQLLYLSPDLTDPAHVVDTAITCMFAHEITHLIPFPVDLETSNIFSLVDAARKQFGVGEWATIVTADENFG